MRRVVRFRSAIAITIAIALHLLAACGGGSDAAGSGGAVAGPPTGLPAAPAPTPTRELVNALAGASFDYVPPGATTSVTGTAYTIRNRPAWAEFDPDTGTLSGTPTASDVGRHPNVTIAGGAFAFTFDLEVVATATGVARLTWEPPLVRQDGTPFDDLAGYRVYYGRSPQQFTQALAIDDAAVREVEVLELSPATWYFVATAVDSFGAESELSPVVSKTIG